MWDVDFVALFFLFYFIKITTFSCWLNNIKITWNNVIQEIKLRSTTQRFRWFAVFFSLFLAIVLYSSLFLWFIVASIYLMERNTIFMNGSQNRLEWNFFLRQNIVRDVEEKRKKPTTYNQYHLIACKYKNLRREKKIHSTSQD